MPKYDAPAANESRNASAARVVYPPALPPLMASRLPSTSPIDARYSAAATGVINVNDTPLSFELLAVHPAESG